MRTVLWIVLEIWAALVVLLLTAWVVWRRVWLPRLLRRREAAFRRMWPRELADIDRTQPVIRPCP